MTYDPIEYWNTRKEPNNANLRDTYTHLKYVHSQLSGCKHILDFGPGTGRMFPAFEDMEIVEGYDISEVYETIVTEHAKEYPFEYVHTINKDPFNTGYPDNYFDAVVCVSVLMHQPPTGIRELMQELARIGKKVIVISWYEKDMMSFDNEICFNHNYREILKELKYQLINSEYGTVNQGMFHQIYFVYRS